MSAVTVILSSEIVEDESHIPCVVGSNADQIDDVWDQPRQGVHHAVVAGGDHDGVHPTWQAASAARRPAGREASAIRAGQRGRG